MLENCLASLTEQLISIATRPIIIVIDNEGAPNNEAITSEFEKVSPFEIAYWHEPRRGIAAARNAGMRMAIEFGADWIAFLDDDEVAEPDWLANLMAPEHRNASILVGHR